MKNKNLISLSLALTFVSLSVTGLLLYLVKHNKTTTSIHVVFGLLFLVFAAFHIINNWPSLISYAKSRNGVSIQKELLVSLLLVGIFLIGTWLRIPPFGEIEELGEEIRNGEGERRRDTKLVFNEIETKKDTEGNPVNIILQKESTVVLPLMAIWVEDSTHTFVENLFVPSKILAVEDGEEDIDEAIREGEIEEKPFDTFLLKTWSETSKDKKPNYSRSTPVSDFILKTHISVNGNYSILIEVAASGKTEVYEAHVNPLNERVFSFKSRGGKMLDRAIVELK
jgi:uncharacterized membrane protein